MAGIVPDEGETLIAQIIHLGTHVDRIADMELGLFTNTSIGEATALSAVTEPTGGGYERKTLTDASWSITDDTASYAQQTFTVTGTDYTGTVYGYFICSKTTSGTARLLYIETDSAGPYTLKVDDTYKITPNVTVS